MGGLTEHLSHQPAPGESLGIGVEADGGDREGRGVRNEVDGYPHPKDRVGRAVMGFIAHHRDRIQGCLVGAAVARTLHELGIDRPTVAVDGQQHPDANARTSRDFHYRTAWRQRVGYSPSARSLIARPLVIGSESGRPFGRPTWRPYMFRRYSPPTS